MKNILFSLLFIIALLFTWQLSENRINIERSKKSMTSLEVFIPSPLTIAKTFQKDGDLILQQLGYTLARAGAGFLIGLVFALLMASIFNFIPLLRQLFYPLSLAINSFPIVGFAPAIILAMGQGTWQSIVFISALICYFPTLINLDSAFKQTDRGLLEQMRVLNATKLQTLTMVKIPLALPAIFTSMKLAIPASIIGATMGEWLGSRTGIGQLITVSLYQLKPGILYGSLLAITLASCITIALISILEKFATPWRFVKQKQII